MNKAFAPSCKALDRVMIFVNIDEYITSCCIFRSAPAPINRFTTSFFPVQAALNKAFAPFYKQLREPKITRKQLNDALPDPADSDLHLPQPTFLQFLCFPYKMLSSKLCHLPLKKYRQ